MEREIAIVKRLWFLKWDFFWENSSKTQICDQRLGPFPARSAKCYCIARNFPDFFPHAIVGNTKLNLGQLPAIAWNIPRLYYVIFLLNILRILKYYY